MFMFFWLEVDDNLSISLISMNEEKSFAYLLQYFKDYSGLQVEVHIIFVQF